jgi:hypothetical protein
MHHTDYSLHCTNIWDHPAVREASYDAIFIRQGGAQF